MEFSTAGWLKISRGLQQLLHGAVANFPIDDQPMEIPGDGWIRKSRDRQTSVDLEYLGKSDEDMTFTVPARMKTDLLEVAFKHKLGASTYVRKLLVLELLGERFHTDWQKAVGQITQDIRRLERE